MVSPNVLICSGHAIKKPSKTVDTITVYPGRNGSSKPISATATTHYVDSKYSGTGNEYDYGIVVLNSNIGNNSGWLGLHVPSSDSGINNKCITVTGYPGDKPSGTMWSDSGTTYDVSTRTFKHNADTMGGQSGSPIYFYSGSTYGYQSIGIHIAGANDDTYNVGRRITKTLFDWLVNQGYVTQ